MVLHKVLLLGATGETGGDILDGLIEAGGFVSGTFISCYVIAHTLNRILAALSSRHLPISPRSKPLKSVVSMSLSLILKETRILWQSL
jgi:hypothetical protein